MKILDCTLRDGGYYTNWDFSENLVEVYFDSFNQLPVEYLEIGYRSNPLNGYLGEFFYCPIYVIENLKSKSNKKLVVILNERDVKPQDVENLLKPCVGLIDMIRLAIDPKNFSSALLLAEAVKKLGFEVGFNVMYMSNWSRHKNFVTLLPEVQGIADYFYMVDSYGGVYPNDVKETYNLVKSNVDVKIGFHGHNNMELGLINTLTAMECGADIVDVTITGMGRGAGNLKTELLLTALNAKGLIDLDFNPLSKVVDVFTDLQKDFEWGTNLPYMVSGANSLPQKDVMDWVGKRFYSFNSIIRALNNQSKGIEDNKNLKPFNENKQTYSNAIVIGGGPSVKAHGVAIQMLLQQNPNTIIIHASSKNAMIFRNLPNNQIFCLVGNEGHRMEDIFKGNLPENAQCVLPTFPRKMGTYIPNNLENVAFELSKVDFTNKFKDSHTAIALQTLIELNVQEIDFVGYDGYANLKIGLKEQELFQENEYLFSNFLNYSNLKINALTATDYTNFEESSIYSKIYGI